MKEIIAIIRMKMVNKTKEALANEGFPGFTCHKVLGRGKKVADEILEEILVNEERFTRSVAETISEQNRLLPNRLINIFVNDEDVERVVETIIDVNQTGEYGDGKIFVLPVHEIVRIRTGETGAEAI